MRRNLPLAALGTVHRGQPHVRQNAFCLGLPLEVSVKVYSLIALPSTVSWTSASMNLAILKSSQLTLSALINLGDYQLVATPRSLDAMLAKTGEHSHWLSADSQTNGAAKAGSGVGCRHCSWIPEVEALCKRGFRQGLHRSFIPSGCCPRPFSGSRVGSSNVLRGDGTLLLGLRGRPDGASRWTN